MVKRRTLPALLALLLSVLFVRDTAEHVALEQASAEHPEDGPPPLRRAFAEATFRDPALRSCSQAGWRRASAVW